jgi:dienelactone hydrolase
MPSLGIEPHDDVQASIPLPIKIGTSPMKRLLRIFVLCCSAWTGAVAQPAPNVPRMAQAVRIPMTTPAGEHLALEGRVYLHEDGARHPAVVLSHGAPRGGDVDRRDPNRGNLFLLAEWFHGRGYVVVTAKRRGYGTSEGTYTESSGRCEHRDYRREGLTSANDIQAMLRYARALPHVDPARIVLAGVSAGGWGSLALASREPEGVIGVVNFAGGRGSVADNTNCDVPSLVKAAGEFGRTVKVPSIWLYAVNDLYLPPTVSRPIYDAFAADTPSRTEYVQLPAYGRDGHATFAARSAVGNWDSAVQRFLNSLPR